MTLLTHTVVKILMDKNVERKFYKYCLLEQHRMYSRNKTNFRKMIEKICLSIKEAFYPYFSVLSSSISAFYPHFSILSSFQRFIPISAFYPHFSVLSSFQRFIPISAFYPHFSFRFQFQFPPFSFSVLSQPRSYFTENVCMVLLF